MQTTALTTACYSVWCLLLNPAVLGRDEEQSQAVAEYADTINRLHNIGAPSGGSNLRFDDGARAVRAEMERKHLELQKYESINRKLASHIGKYNGIFARLCIVWHCVEHAGRSLPAVVSEATARRVGGFLHGASCCPMPWRSMRARWGCRTTMTGLRLSLGISWRMGLGGLPTGTYSAATAPCANWSGGKLRPFLINSMRWVGLSEGPPLVRQTRRTGS